MLCKVLLLAVLISWSRSRSFAWFKARVPENTQESGEILTEEPETLEDFEEKLISLIVVKNGHKRNKWNRLYKRGQKNKTHEK